MTFSRLLHVSRPRFWMYLIGPYLLGVTAANPKLAVNKVLELILFGLYFTLPANLMVYGVNDICDYDTDRLNPKKQNYEVLLKPQERRALILAILTFSVPFVFLMLRNIQLLGYLYFGLFLALSIFYSSPPIRAKAIPIVDSVFNVLYAMPGFFGWSIAGGTGFCFPIFLACLCWTMAMHAFSAVPDIDSDREANLRTIATLLGRSRTIVVCGLLYAAAAILAAKYIGPISLILGLIYVRLMILGWKSRAGKEMTVYKSFPLINSLVGFSLFLDIFLSKRLHM